jgi:hypothetical protein
VTQRSLFPILLLAAACATTKGAGTPIRQADHGLPSAGQLPDGPERAAYSAAHGHEAKGDAAGAAHDQARGEWATAAAGYAELAARAAVSEWRVPLRHRAAELFLRAQRWEKAAEAAQAIVADPQASDASRAIGARLAALAWLGAANAAVKAGQLEKLELGADRKDGPRAPPAAWKRVVESTDAYLARAGVDPELRRASSDRRASAADLALVAAEVQYAYGEIDDARRRLEAALERWPGDPELLEQAIPIYLASFLVRGDRPGYTAAAERLRERIEAEAARSPEKKAALAKVLDGLGRARAGARLAGAEDLLRQGKAADAARTFEAAAAAEPGAPEAANALHNAGVAWDQAGEPAKAAAVRERLLRDHADAAVTADDALRLATFRSRQGDHLGAARLYEDFLRRWPGSQSRCLALRNVASELDVAERPAEAAGKYLAFGKDAGCAKADPNIAARALVRAGRLFDAQAKAAYGGAAALQGVTEPEAKGQVAEAKRRLKGH